MSELKFYALIIGTEILNKRRQDKHFNFLSTELAKYGQKLTASFVIEDDPDFIANTITFIASQTNSILFSFGGIGSTPDDHTRLAASTALSDGKLYNHNEAEQIIRDKLKEKLSKHSLNMAQLPKNATLIENPFNGMPAFSLNNRFFFVPGFPEMSHPMIEAIVPTLLTNKEPTYRYTLTALCAESRLIEIMKQMPKEVEFSSLPKHYTDGWRTVISVASRNQELAKKAFAKYTHYLDTQNIYYSLQDDA